MADIIVPIVAAAAVAHPPPAVALVVRPPLPPPDPHVVQGVARLLSVVLTFCITLLVLFFWPLL